MPYFADVRLKKELETLDLPPNSTLEQLKPLDPVFHTTFLFTTIIKEGIYKDKKYVFHINIFEDYPFKPPKIKCLTKIFHPNIENNCVCINIIREDWTSAFGLQIILFGLYRLFFDFNNENSLNVEAGDLLEKDYDLFVRRVKEE
ncbi:NEDD8-conjugating protein ubc12 [Gurleya vavrai]